MIFVNSIKMVVIRVILPCLMILYATSAKAEVLSPHIYRSYEAQLPPKQPQQPPPPPQQQYYQDQEYLDPNQYKQYEPQYEYGEDYYEQLYYQQELERQRRAQEEVESQKGQKKEEYFYPLYY